MDDFSIESLYEMGLGLKTDNIIGNENDNSLENFEDENSVAYEIANTESLINSLETYKKINDMNISQKLNMMKRIKTVYGYYSRGLENYCENNIRSIEEQTVSNNKKNDSILKKIFSAIAMFFRKIWQFICSIPTRIMAFIDHLKRYGLKGAFDEANAAGNAKMIEMENKYLSKKERLSDSLERSIEECNRLLKQANESVKHVISIFDQLGKELPQNTSEQLYSEACGNIIKSVLSIIERLLIAMEYGVRIISRKDEKIKQLIINLEKPNHLHILNMIREGDHAIVKVDTKLRLINEDNAARWNEDKKLTKQMVEETTSIGKIYKELIVEYNDFINSLKTNLPPEIGKPINEVSQKIKNFTDEFVAINSNLNMWQAGDKLCKEALTMVNKIFTDKKTRDTISSMVIGAKQTIDIDKLIKEE